jgi:hypothetical protein
MRNTRETFSGAADLGIRTVLNSVIHVAFLHP